MTIVSAIEKDSEVNKRDDQCGRRSGLRKFASRKMGCESVKKRMCLRMRRYGVPSSRGPWSSSLQGIAEVSLYAFGGHFLANLLQSGYFLFASGSPQ